MLNIIWSSFFLIGFVAAAYQLFFEGNQDVISNIIKNTFDMSKVGFQLALGLTGVMAFWLGIMKIGERAGMIDLLNRLFGPLFRRFFPELPADHPAIGSMTLNLAANMLGIDNAATPFGLKAMEQLEASNPNPGTASNSQIMFLVINTSAVTIIPISIFTYLFELGFSNPTEVFFPILLATFASTLGGVTLTCLIQRISMKEVLPILLGAGTLLFGSLYFLSQLEGKVLNQYSFLVSNFIILTIIIVFLTKGLLAKVNVYEAFIDGAKDGFQVAIGIIPYLIAMLVGIGVFRASGALDLFMDGLSYLLTMCTHVLSWVGLMQAPKESFVFLDALPTAMMKPLSGSGARAMMVDTIKTHGVDSLVSKMVATVQGSTETTFYVLAVYFGSVKIRFTRYAAGVGLFADFIGAIVAIISCYIFFPTLS
jgi:spore maturation protein SpmA